MNTIPPGKPDTKPKPRPNSLAYMVTVSLGYCCEWWFYAKFKDDEMIAARLGVTARAVRSKRRAFRNGEMGCESQDGCINTRLGYPTAKQMK